MLSMNEDYQLFEAVTEHIKYTTAAKRPGCDTDLLTHLHNKILQPVGLQRQCMASI